MFTRFSKVFENFKEKTTKKNINENLFYVHINIHVVRDNRRF